MNRYPAPSRAFIWVLALMFVALTLQSSPARATDNTDEKLAVIAANRAFYKAFRESDLEALDALWAKKPKCP